MRETGHKQPMLTPAQCRAARGLLDWTQQELADEARVGIVTIRQFEGELSDPRRATVEVIKQALSRAGVEFIEENGGGPGVRLRKTSHRAALVPLAAEQRTSIEVAFGP